MLKSSRARGSRLVSILAVAGMLVAMLPMFFTPGVQAQVEQSTAWTGEYFANTDLSGDPVLVRDDAVIDFNWGNGSPDDALPDDYFSARWTGTISVEAGNYLFATTTDDGVRLWVDGNLVIDQWVPRPATYDEAELTLTDGDHEVVMEYFEMTGQASARLTYKNTDLVDGEVLRINAGGGSFIDSFGNIWSPDRDYVGGSSNTNAQTIWNTNDGGLYTTERLAESENGSFAYEVPVVDGSYTVRLHFAELFHNFVSLRAFDVDIEGSQVLSNFDVLAEAGGRATLITRSFPATVTDGVLNITFTSQNYLAMVNALEIYPAEATVDLTNPVMQPIPETGNLTYSEPPTVTLAISDDQGIHNAQWRIGNVGPQSIFSNHPGTEFNEQFTIPQSVFDGLPLGSHTLAIFLNDDNGNTAAQTWRFRKLDSGGSSDPIAFNRRVLADATTPGLSEFTRPTAVTFGPDGRLYVAQQNGYIFAMTLDGANNITDVDTISTIYNTPNFNADGSPAGVAGRLVVGLDFDPASTPEQPIMWLTHSDPRLCYGEPNCPINEESGVLTRIVGPEYDNPANRTDLVTGIPRSKEIHSATNVHFGPDGWLYMAVGSMTNFGAPSAAFNQEPEHFLAAAILRFNVNAAAGSFPLDVSDVSGPEGLIPGVFELYATGYRNAYDFVFHSNGNLYVNTNNGNSANGTTPGPEHGCPDGVVVDPGNQYDFLALVDEGDYGGHPAPVRNECVYGDGTLYSPDLPPEPHYREPIFTYQNGFSVNGIAEYRVPTFGGQMIGNLISVAWTSDQAVRRVVLSQDGQTALFEETLGTFNQPLDVAVGQDGSIFVVEHGGNTLQIMEPAGEANAGYWNIDEPMPVETQEMGTVACDGAVYVIGGLLSGGEPTNNVWAYFPASKQWLARTPYPGDMLSHQGVACVDGKIYTFGGFPPGGAAVASTYEYDIASNSWTQKADMPAPRGGMGVAVLNGVIYAAGGLPQDTATPGALSDMASYDPATDTWQTLAPMPTARDHLIMEASNGILYAIGGRNYAHESAVTANEGYNPTTNTWSTYAPMPIARAGMASGNLYDRIQIWGGEGPAGSSFGTYPEGHQYDGRTDTWTTIAPMLTSRHGMGGATIGDYVYVPGGGPAQGMSMSDANEVFSFVSSAPPSSCIDPDSNPTIADSDTDGYTDQDETDNGTDPCNPSSVPADFDGDGVSNLNDPDIDGDQVPNEADQYDFDPNNGSATGLPWAQSWNPGDGPAGLIGNSGFTGSQLTTNGTGFIAEHVRAGGAAGFLVITATEGTNAGPVNAQDNALQTGFDATAPVVISARVSEPMSGLDVVPGKSGGIFFGLDEDNYIKLVLDTDNGSGSTGLVFAVETDGTYVANPSITPVDITLPGPTNLDLFLVLDPAAGTITAQYRVDSSDEAAIVTIGTVNAADFPGISDFFQVGAAAGVLTTNNSSSHFALAFDYFRIDPGQTSGGNQQPVASASATPQNGDAPLTVQFSGDDSTDPDNDPLTYSWDFGDGSTPSTGANPQHTYDSDGTYVASLTVSDGQGGFDTDTVTINVGSVVTPGPCAIGEFSATYFNNMTLTGDPVLERCETAINNEWGGGSPDPGVSTNNFSARWTGTHTFGAGTYTFTTTADDGVRVFVNGTLLINQWKDQGPTTYTATVDLTAGEHEVVVEYYENGGGAVAKLSWQQTSGTPPPPPTCEIGQYLAEHYNNATLSGDPIQERCESSINYDFGNGGPTTGIGSDDFSIRWTGTHLFDAGIHTFSATADDGVRVFVDGFLLIDQWKDQGPTTYTATINLTAGEHEVVVEYYENGGGSVINVDWTLTTPGDPEENQPPVASAGATLTSGMAPLAVAFSSAGSSDPDSDALTYGWDFGDGSAPSTSSNPQHTYDTAGTFVATLTVNDGNGGTDTDTVTVVVSDPDTGTSCAAGQYQAQYFPNMTLSGTPVTEQCENAPINYDWAWGGPAGVGGDQFSVRWTGTHSFEAGTHTFTATVDDGMRVYLDGTLILDEWRDQSATTFTAQVDVTAGEHIVVVEFYENSGSAVAELDWTLTDPGDPGDPENQQPVAVASASPTNGPAPLTVDFSGTGSSDPDDDQLTYQWDFGDGSTPAQGANAQHTYQSAGSYTASLTVSDGQGGTDTDSVTIVVDDPDGGETSCPTGQFQASYFNNIELSGNPVLERCETAIANEWGSGSPHASVNINGFSARWAGTHTFEAETYTFRVTADDGIRLYLDGVLIIDEWKDQGATTFVATVDVTAGEHDVVVEYYENSADAVAAVSWEISNGDGSITCQDGEWLAEHYSNMTLGGTPVTVRCEESIDNDWGSGGPGTGTGTNQFSIRWTTTQTFDAGSYTFTATADDGVRVFVDGNLIIDEWKNQPPTTYAAEVDLTQGEHEIVVEYYEGSGGAVAQLAWAPTQ